VEPFELMFKNSGNIFLCSVRYLANTRFHISEERNLYWNPENVRAEESNQSSIHSRLARY